MDSAVAPLPDLIDESLDEAAFLFHRWEAELTSLTRNLDEVWSWTEDRLQGALEGVRVAGAGLVEVATRGLSEEIDRITVCAGLLASSQSREASEVLAAALAAAEGEKLSAIVRGLEILGTDQALQAASRALAVREPADLGAICRLTAFHRVVRRDDVAAALESESAVVQVEALRAVRHLPAAEAERWIGDALHNEDPHVRYAAVESGTSLGMSAAWDTAKAVARQLGPDAGPYLKLLAMFGKADDHDVVYAALRIAHLQPQAVWALGHIGTSRAVESCLAGMRHETVARACGEAYCWITGADLARDRLAATETLPDAPPFDEDGLDADLVPPAEALWPLPDLEAVRRHWAARSAAHAANVRHVHGRPVTTDTLIACIETGPMLRRPDLILEVRARTRGRYDVEPRAFTGRQRSMMAASRAAARNHAGR